MAEVTHASKRTGQNPRDVFRQFAWHLAGNLVTPKAKRAGASRRRRGAHASKANAGK